MKRSASSDRLMESKEQSWLTRTGQAWKVHVAFGLLFGAIALQTYVNFFSEASVGWAGFTCPRGFGWAQMPGCHITRRS